MVQGGDDFLAWEWLDAQPAAAETHFMRHVRLGRPVLLKADGRQSRCVIVKPAPVGAVEADAPVEVCFEQGTRVESQQSKFT